MGNMHTPIAPDPWVSSQAMPHINYALRSAGHSETVADELTRALGLLAAHGVLQITHKGIYAPGTTNRVITIKGSARSVKCGLQLVKQKIQEKMEERNRSGR